MKVDIGQWVCEAWVWSLRMVPKAGWEQNMLHGVKRVVKFCETISAVFTVNLEDFRRYYRYSSCVCINNWLYTGHQIILAHRWLQVQELHGVWHPLPEPEWYKTQSLGAKSPFRCVWRSFGETLWEQRLIRIEWMSDIRMMQQNFFNLLAALSRYMTWHTTHSRRISQNVRSLGLYETFYVCFCLSGSPCICSDLSITQNS